MNRCKGIRVVFMDIDDTLLSFSGYVREAMRSGFVTFGLGVYRDDMFGSFVRINTELWQQIERGKLTLPELEQVRWNRVFCELGIDFDGVVFERYFREQLNQSAILVPYAVELVGYLASRYVLCAASNGPYEQQVNRLRIAGLLPSFERVFVSERVGAQKPSKEFFDRCFKELRNTGMSDLRPEETIIIGDSLTSDIAGGRGYGMRTCLYRADVQLDATDCGADYVVSSLRQVEDIL